MHIVGNLDPGRLRATVDATSSDGLVAHLRGRRPGCNRAPRPFASPWRHNGAGTPRGRCTARPRALWAAARLPDQSLEGAAQRRRRTRISARAISPATGHIEIADGRFEDKLTGVALRRSRCARGDRASAASTIENFSAARSARRPHHRDRRQRQPSQEAASLSTSTTCASPTAPTRAPRQRRTDARLGGPALARSPAISTSSKPTSTSPPVREAGIPTMDVIEINRPGEDDERSSEATKLRVRNGATDLNVRIRAPGRVFTRGRGVDAEWSLDLRAGRHLAQRRCLFGEARAIRGTWRFQASRSRSKTLDIEFDGDPLDARIDLTAVRDTADLTAAHSPHRHGARSGDHVSPAIHRCRKTRSCRKILFGRSVRGSLGARSGAACGKLGGALRARVARPRGRRARRRWPRSLQRAPGRQTAGSWSSGGVYLTRGRLR